MRNCAAGEVGDVVAGSAAQSSGQQDPGKTVFTEKALCASTPGKQQRDVALDHHQEKDGIETIATDEVVKKIEMHD